MCFLLLISPYLSPCFPPFVPVRSFPPCPFSMSSEGMWSRRCHSLSLCGCSEASRRASPTPSFLVFKSQCEEVHNASRCVCGLYIYVIYEIRWNTGTQIVEEGSITLRSTCSFGFYLEVAVDLFMCLLHLLRHLRLSLSLHSHCPHQAQCY